MKRFYMLLSGSMLCAFVFVNMTLRVSAQYIHAGLPSPNGLISPIGTIPVSQRPAWNNPSDDSRTVTGKWLEYWHVEDSIGNAGGGIPVIAYQFLLPDSFVIACTPPPATCFNPAIHLIANVLDPSSMDMQSIEGYKWSNTNPYTVDSLAINYAYARKSDAGVVDTLIVYLWNNAVSGDIDETFGFVYPGNPFGSDTIIFAGLHYDSTGTNMPNVSAGGLKTFKILLTEADTATLAVNFGSKVINTNHFSVPAGKLVASAFSFKPGTVYQQGDTIPNTFFFYSDEPNGAASCATYTKGDYNVSEVINSDVRYNHNLEHDDGLFLPTWLFFNCLTNTYPIQEHEISYYVTGTFDVGINESVSSEGLKLYQSQPNPANHTALVMYETQTAGTVILEVRDLTGRLVMELNQGVESGGKHNAVIDVSGLSKGMYLYTLKTKNESLTRRMIVSE